MFFWYSGKSASVFIIEEAGSTLSTGTAITLLSSPSSVPINPGIVVKCRAIGIAEMSDEEGEDNKVIAVPVDKVDPASSMIKTEADLPEYQKNKLKHFFEHYKELEKGKFMKFHGFKGKEEALKQIKGAKV